jgi:hypothetical protein
MFRTALFVALAILWDLRFAGPTLALALASTFDVKININPSQKHRH